EKSKSLEGRFWYSENWDNRLFQRDIHNEIHATKDISSGCYLQGIELWEYKWDTINNEQKGNGATNRDDYKDQARWSSPSIQDFGNFEVYIWTSDHGRWIDSKHILMAHNRRFPHSHEISSYLNESTVMGTDWVTIMEHM
ncbi:hypothetical protein HID58_047015, partial [Brassica napus]